MKRVELWKNGPLVSRIALGCWPMSGISSLGVSDGQSIDTVRQAIDLGVNFFDTAYSYGYDGRSDRVLKEGIRGKREQVFIAHKVGQHWDSNRTRVVDGRPEILLRHAKECLQRLERDSVDLLYLHCPDPAVPLAESAQAIAEICQMGWAKKAGVCNVDETQAVEFMAHCPTVAIQVPFNMLQQEQHIALRNLAQSQDIKLICYWVYMKGLLAGHMKRDHVLAPEDRRRTYEIFQGDGWHRAHDLIDQLRLMAQAKNATVAQIVAAWTLQQPGGDIVLLGAKTREQMLECARSDEILLTAEDGESIASVLSTSNK